jgi:hypothetical protein
MLTVHGQSHRLTINTVKSASLHTLHISLSFISPMASSNLDNLFHTIWPSAASWQREVAKCNLAHAKEHLDTVASMVSNDSEDLHEEQADWCKR